MNILAALWHYVKPTPLPRYEIVEVIGGGPDDGEMYWLNTSLPDGAESVWNGLRYRVEWRNAKRVWRFVGFNRPASAVSVKQSR